MTDQLSATQRLAAANNVEHSTTDALGRKINFKRPSLMTRMGVMEILDANVCNNTVYMGYAMLLAAVTSIDGMPMEPLTDMRALKNAMAELDEVGLVAVAQGLAAIDKPASEPKNPTP